GAARDWGRAAGVTLREADPARGVALLPTRGRDVRLADNLRRNGARADASGFWRRADRAHEWAARRARAAGPGRGAGDRLLRSSKPPERARRRPAARLAL